jgi:hypothetical protein
VFQNVGTTIGAKINMLQAACEYKGTVLYTVTENF